MLLVAFPGESSGSSPAESSSLSESSLLLFHPDFNKMCLFPIWCWQYLIPSCCKWKCLIWQEFQFSPLFFSLPFLCLISKSWHVEDVWANLISLLPSLGRTAEIVFNTSIPSLLQSVLIKIAQGSHLHIYHSTYPQIMPQLCHSWTFRRDWSATPGL